MDGKIFIVKQKLLNIKDTYINTVMSLLTNKLVIKTEFYYCNSDCIVPYGLKPLRQTDNLRTYD